MGFIQGPSKVPFTNIADLNRPGTPFITYFLISAQGQSSGQEFVWSDTANDYVPVGDVAYNVIGTWNASTNTPNHSTALTVNGNALSVAVEGTTNINGFDRWNVGDLLVRNNDIFFRVPNQPDVISGLTSNRVPIFNGTTFQDSSIREDANTTLIDKEMQATPGSIIQGGYEIEERGGFMLDNSNLSGRDFAVLDYQIQDSGTSDPLYFRRDARENDIKPRADFPNSTDTTQYNDVSTISIDLQTDSDIFAFYVNFRTDVTGLRFKIESPNSTRPIKFFPTQADYESSNGTDFTSGLQRIELETPTGTVSGTTLTATLEADNDINLLGNSNFPYLNVDRQLWEEVTMVHNDNIVNQVGGKLVEGSNVTINVDETNDNITISSTGSGGGNFVPGDHSITEFNDVTDAGSGQIITDSERNKLSGIEIGSEENVQSNWSETNTNSDSFIQNKPTIPTPRTDEDIRDVMASTLRAGDGIRITEDDVNNIITISADDGDDFNAPRITNFRINIEPRVDLNTNLNTQHTVTFDVMHSANIASLTLDVESGTNQMLTNPSQDGIGRTQTITLNGISTSVSGSNVIFKITGVDTEGDSFESNDQTVNIRTLQDHEYLYYGLSSSNNPVNVDISSLTRLEVTISQRSYTVTAGPTTAGQYFILLTQDSEELQSITDDVFNQDVTTIFTKTEDVRQINSNNYDSYVLGPLNAGATESFVVLFQ